MSAQLQIETLVLGELQTNCYLVWNPGDSECLIIDPADDGTFITDTILKHKLQPSALILTHGHFDHVLGCLELKLNFDIPIFLHPADTFLLDEAKQRAEYWLHHPVDPVPKADLPLKEGQQFALADHILTVLETPGHTPGSICLTTPEIVFTGDTLFKDGVGRTDFSYSSPSDLEKSLARLQQLPSPTITYPGHGESGILLD